MISDEKIREIRERASIVEVISDYLTLKKVGSNYLGLCPFHAEKTPSFTSNEEKGIFHCFGCGAGGNVFNFLMQYDHLNFPEAVERVGRRYGIVIQRVEGSLARREGERKEGLYRLNEWAAAYFQKALYKHPERDRVARYLKARGVEEQIARRFALGYAPSGGYRLASSVQKEGLSMSDAVRLGLLSDKGQGRYGERFFGRLMFPIMDPAGKVVGFGGRVIDEGLPKYLNSAETPLFHKSAQVYGLFQAKESIRAVDRVVVVEGYLDVLALAQSGISYAVATLGTSLTPDHVRILRRYTKNVIALFDGDEAGRKAAARSFEIFVEGGLLGQAAFLPDGEDPDSFVRSRGKESLEAVIDQAIPLADYFLTWLEGQYGKSLEDKSRIAQEISRVLTKVRNPFEVDLLIRRAADLLGIREELLRQPPVSSRGVSTPHRDRPGQDLTGRVREDLAESSLVTLMLCFPSLLARVGEVAEIDRLVSSKWRGIVRGILSEWRERGKVDVAHLTQSFPPEQAAEVAALALQGETIGEDEGDRMAEDCLFYLKRKYLKGLEEDLRKAIRVAEERKDDKDKRERMIEWQEVVRRKQHLVHQRSFPRTAIR
ncbi:MAG: DNA primase [Deltaproteobacteria bacterium]|nr:DNA primase [Deltaproteobacteria bacterium]